jgi:outer membrane protein OmpA-like peptidoglycan-associated protein
MPTSRPALEEIAKLLRARPTLRVHVVGHTDSQGTIAYNMTLSENRARSIVRALVTDFSITQDRLQARGVRPLVPVFTNKAEGGRQKNRRVELVER